jgi:exopolysaccharide biosynthesis polyprenyl glycosylphosphotransferase
MVKLFSVYFPGRILVLFLSDFALVVLGMLSAVFIWSGRESGLFLIYGQGALKLALVSIIFMASFYFCDLYSTTAVISTGETFARLIEALGVALTLQGLVYLVFPPIRLVQEMLVIGVVSVGIVLLAWRRVFLAIGRWPCLGERIALLGEGTLARQVASEIQKRPELGMKILGYISSSSEVPGAVDGLPRLGPPEEIEALVEKHKLEEIFVTMEDQRGNLPIEDLLRLKMKGVTIRNGLDAYEGMLGRVAVHSLRPSGLLFSKGYSPPAAILICTRLVSILFSALGLLISFPIMALVGVAIKLGSKGPIIVRQRRVGMRGKIFNVYKFRSMYYSYAWDDPTSPTKPNDRRITRVGRFIRRFRLDELPQLYNILCGDMSFVGPRPFVPSEEMELARQIPFYSQRWSVKPGATGWAQINQGYCATLDDNIKKLGYDLFYIKNLSPALDVLILLRTAKTLLLGRGAR